MRVLSDRQLRFSQPVDMASTQLSPCQSGRAAARLASWSAVLAEQRDELGGSPIVRRLAFDFTFPAAGRVFSR